MLLISQMCRCNFLKDQKLYGGFRGSTTVLAFGCWNANLGRETIGCEVKDLSAAGHPLVMVRELGHTAQWLSSGRL